MRTIHLMLVVIAIHVAIHTASVRGQDPIGLQLTIAQRPLRWDRYAYEMDSSYPYLKELPDWSKIPILLEWINRETHDAGVEVAHSQLVALSRADFGHPQHPPAGGLPAETIDYHKTQRNEAWARWWKSVGRAYSEQLRSRGRQNPEAWRLVTRDNAQPLPDYKVTIPDEWVLRTSYRAGDYGGVQTESLTLRRSKGKATLIRALRKSTRGQLEWERWQSLTTEQADDFAFAVAYAIDNPWLLKPKAGGGSLEKLEGRDLTLYYGGFRYEFGDLDGNIWWNDDPWHWHGVENFDGSFMNAAGLGSVCLLLWRSFPDSSATNAATSDSGGWRSLKMPDAMVLQQVAEDLTLRGETIDTLWHAQRLTDGLETLTEFGTPEQVPAIRRLETELPVRMEKVATLFGSGSKRGTS